MANPVELTKLGVKARFQKLGLLRYIWIAALLALALAGLEISRYSKYQDCVDRESGRAFLADEKQYLQDHPDSKNEDGLEFFHKMGGQDWYFGTLHAARVKCNIDYPYDVFQWLSLLNPITKANAQIRFSGYSENDIRGIVIISIFTCMGIFFFLSTGAVMLSKNAKVVAFAMRTI